MTNMDAKPDFTHSTSAAGYAPRIPMWEVHYYHDWLRANRERQPVGRTIEDYWNGQASGDDAVEALTRWMLRNKRYDEDGWRDYATFVSETMTGNYLSCAISGYLGQHLPEDSPEVAGRIS